MRRVGGAAVCVVLCIAACAEAMAVLLHCYLVPWLLRVVTQPLLVCLQCLYNVTVGPAGLCQCDDVVGVVGCITLPAMHEPIVLGFAWVLRCASTCWYAMARVCQLACGF
jgi:hypothetical protein